MNTVLDESAIQSEGRILVLLAIEESECKWSLERLYLKTIPLELSDLFVMN